MNIRIISAVAKQLVFGVDTISGIILYVLVTAIFNQDLSGKMLAFAVGCALLPDIDFIPYFLGQKRFKFASHWTVGHHPYLYAACIAIVAGATDTSETVEGQYAVTLASCCIFAHFIHDSMQIQGMYWWYPFHWSRITFAYGFPRRPSQEDMLRCDTVTESNRHLDKTTQVINRLEKVSGIQVTIFIAAVSSLYVYWIST